MRTRGRVVGVALACGVLAAGVGVGLDWGRQRASPPAGPCGAALAAPAPAAAPAGLVGHLQPATTRSLFASVDGFVSVLLVKSGARVKRGQVLARLDDDEARVEAARALAGLITSNASLYAAELTHARLLAHIAPDGKLGAPPAFEEDSEVAHVVGLSEARIASAVADAAASAAGVQRARRRLARHTIRAPADGVVVWTSAERDRRAPAGALLFVLDVEPGRLRVVVPIVDDRLAQLSVGQTATVSVPGVPGRKLGARLAEIHTAAAALGLRGHPEALFTLNEASDGLRADMAVTVALDSGRSTAAALQSPAWAADE